MSKPWIGNPNASYWDDLVEEFGFSLAEQRQIREGADRMIAEVRARRLVCPGRGDRAGLAGACGVGAGEGTASCTPEDDPA